MPVSLPDPGGHKGVGADLFRGLWPQTAAACLNVPLQAAPHREGLWRDFAGSHSYPPVATTLLCHYELAAEVFPQAP